MSTTLVLDALKKHRLGEYYPSITSQGISNINRLAELTVHDCPKFGILSTEEKSRFAALTQDLRETVGNMTKKRIINTKIDPRSRRMTLAPQSLIPKTPPKPSVRERRLSYLPRRQTMFQRPTVPKQVSPSKPKTVARPPFLDELNREKKEDPIEKPTRYLNTYGVPLGQKQQQSKTSSASEAKSNPFIQDNTASTTCNLPQSSLNQRIRVCVRKRPLSKKEMTAKERDITSVIGNRTLQVNAPRTKVDLTRVIEQYPFVFDDVFDSKVTNKQIYERTAQPLVDYVFNGGKATCFAHGQTGSGKTYTMLDPNHGLYFLAAKDIFRLLSSHRYSHLKAYVAFYEIYQNQIYDLLNDRKKLLAQVDANNDVVISNLKYYRVNEVQDLIKIFDLGNHERATGQTGANTNSSRSHAILQIILKDGQKSGDYGKLSFIDLAGSERGADRGDTSAKTRVEGAEINKSLLALKECIRALDQGQKHTPFRGSKLTLVLRDSFIGDSRTCMIATISPNISNSDHTLNTLRYADRVKELKSESTATESPSNDIEMDTKPTTHIFNTMSDKKKNNMSSIEHMFEDEPENLLDVSFPDVNTNALSTPKSNRLWDEKTSELRRMNYIKRIESPPPEAFRDDNFIPQLLESISHHPTELPKKRKAVLEDEPVVKKQKATISIERVRKFIKMHRAHIKELDDCLRAERTLATDLSLMVTGSRDFRGDNEMDDIDDKTKAAFESYLNELDELLNRKQSCVEVMLEKINEISGSGDKKASL